MGEWMIGERWNEVGRPWVSQCIISYWKIHWRTLGILILSAEQVEVRDTCKDYFESMQSIFWKLVKQVQETYEASNRSLKSFYWKLARLLLEACWASTGSLQRFYWKLAELLLEACRASTGSLQSFYWTLAKHLLGDCKASFSFWYVFPINLQNHHWMKSINYFFAALQVHPPKK